jgi:hypothetical protein
MTRAGQCPERRSSSPRRRAITGRRPTAAVTLICWASWPTRIRFRSTLRASRRSFKMASRYPAATRSPSAASGSPGSSRRSARSPRVRPRARSRRIKRCRSLLSAVNSSSPRRGRRRMPTSPRHCWQCRDFSRTRPAISFSRGVRRRRSATKSTGSTSPSRSTKGRPFPTSSTAFAQFKSFPAQAIPAKETPAPAW